MLFGRTSQFFLAKVTGPSYTFTFTPGYGSGSFFIFAEVKGGTVGSTVVRLQPRGVLPRRVDAVAFAAPPEPPAVQWVKPLQNVTPSGATDPSLMYNVLLSTGDTPLPADCSFDLRITQGPMTFTDGTREEVVTIPQGFSSSQSATILAPPQSTLRQQTWVSLSMYPRNGCPPLRIPSPLLIKMPPDPVDDITWTWDSATQPGDGHEPITVFATVLDGAGAASISRPWRVALTLPVQSGYGDVFLSPQTPATTVTDDTAGAKWIIYGHLQVAVTPTVVVDTGHGLSQPYHPGTTLQFRFPTAAVLLALLSAGSVRFLLGRRIVPTIVTALLTGALYVGALYAGFLRGKDFFGLPLDPSVLPLGVWPMGAVFGVLVGFVYDGIVRLVSGGREPTNNGKG